MTDIRDPNNKPKDITPFETRTTAEQQNDSSPPSASKAQEQLTDEEIHIKEIEDKFHDEQMFEEEPDEEFEIDW